VPGRKRESTSYKSKGKRDAGESAEESAASARAERPPRAGLPAEDSIIGEKRLRSPKGRVYRILITDEMDAYDKPERTRKKRRRKH
jgi:hypothetical protein